jgi:hypothetical protein
LPAVALPATELVHRCYARSLDNGGIGGGGGGGVGSGGGTGAGRLRYVVLDVRARRA